MHLNKNSLDLLLISFVFYIHNSLEKQTENSGVFFTKLLGCGFELGLRKCKEIKLLPRKATSIA